MSGAAPVAPATFAVEAALITGVLSSLRLFFLGQLLLIVEQQGEIVTGREARDSSKDADGELGESFATKKKKMKKRNRGTKTKGDSFHEE